MEFSEHVRFRELMEHRLREQQKEKEREAEILRERMERVRLRE